MEREKQRRGGAFNGDEIAELLAKFEQSTLSEMRVKSGDVEVLFRRESRVPPVAAPTHYHSVPTAGEALSAAPGPSSGAGQPAAASGLEVVVSPIVGTFYRSPAPDAPPFVERGAQVAKGRTLCILEAMKLMNELEAEFDCEIVSILMESGKMVEFGTPLFEVRRA
jgi:acetyl-CoA carboxylase biotin carboxyl carrier protein